MLLRQASLNAELSFFGLFLDRSRSTSAAVRLDLVQDVVIQDRMRRNQRKSCLLRSSKGLAVLGALRALDGPHEGIAGKPVNRPLTAG